MNNISMHWDANNKDLLSIAYPGITVEAIPGTKNIYEVVWNCGGLSVMMNLLAEENVREKVFPEIVKILEVIKSINTEVIFVMDEGIFQKNSYIISAAFKEIFWDNKYRIVTVTGTGNEKNPLSGLRVNHSGFSQDIDLIGAITSLPNATVLSSIPRSDPRISQINKELEMKDLLLTNAGKTLQLLELNASKENQIKIAGESMGFLGRVNNAAELKKIFEDHPDEIFVTKDIEGAAGWTDVNFITNKSQQDVVLERNLFPILVYKFLKPMLITGEKGNHPVQFRPMILQNNEFAGGTIKFPAKPLMGNGFHSGSGKNAFAEQNKELNTSSGQTNSFFLNEKGEVVWGYIFEKNGLVALNAESSEKFFE